MKRASAFLATSAILVAISITLYAVLQAFMGSARDAASSFLQELAFLPVDLLLVTFIIDQVLNAREKKGLLNKLNMIIGAFFAEVGKDLLRACSAADLDSERIRPSMIPQQGWTRRTYEAAMAEIKAFDYTIEKEAADLDAMKGLLVAKRDFLVRLLENPLLLEHDSFTDMLWAVFHLAEELVARPSLEDLPGGDFTHLVGDIARAYRHLAVEWLSYLQHLQARYPYLFSLAARTNPMDPGAAITVG